MPSPLITSLPELFTAIFTPDDNIAIIQAWRAKGGGPQFHQHVLSTYVEPRMAKIDELTGQKNDSRYIAYGVEAYIHRLG